jgi:hypothetical protein
LRALLPFANLVPTGGFGTYDNAYPRRTTRSIKG